ncbi:MAG: hypothetical protein QOH63_2477 [Acidobacteriota bacterium]|jgi:hypothetical protein|nr:hypothetical protein [Acidobacteriota bacterium]
MKLIKYSFKSEAIWILIFSLGLPLLGLLVFLIVRLFS